MSPPARVAAAMPGTIHELMARTGYPQEAVRRAILNLRREGKRVNAVEDGISRNVNSKRPPEESVPSTTIFTLDNTGRAGGE